MTEENTDSPNRIERVLAAMMLGLTGLGVLSFFAVIIGTATGMTIDDVREGIWPIVGSITLPALTAAALLMVTLTILVAVRRKRQNSEGGAS